MAKTVMVNRKQLQQLVDAASKTAALARDIIAEIEYGPIRIEYGLLDGEYYNWAIGGQFEDVPFPENGPFKNLADAKASAEKRAKKEGCEVSEHNGNLITTRTGVR